MQGANLKNVTVFDLIADLNHLAVTSNSPKLIPKWIDMERNRENKMVNTQQRKCLKYVDNFPS